MTEKLGTGGGRTPGGIRRTAVRIAVLAAVLTVAPFWARAVVGARETFLWAREKPVATLVGYARGPGFSEAVDRIRDVVPPDGSYLVLVDPYDAGALNAIALRQALLPRRPVLLKRFDELPGKPSARLLATVVIESDDSAPVVTGEVPVFEPLDPGSLGREDDSLVASVDEVSFDATGRIRIRGWCQGNGAVPCDVAAVLVGGLSVPVFQVSREPRPDVEAALPEIGPCPRAGYRLTLAQGVAVGSTVSIRVVFRTADGRWRKYPEQVAERAR